MKKNLVIVFLSGVMAASSLPAADKHQHMDPYVQGPANETGLAQEVRHKLIMLPRFGVFDDLGFRVEGSTVILEGQVAQPILKDDAEHAVKKIEGVTNVVNNIEVLPLSPNDDRIRRAMFRAIYGDPEIGTRYGYSAVPSIHIIVKNGDVRLEGVVSNEMDRNLIGIRANGVPGVFKVENDLRVEGSNKS
ncbi:MAG TPA: BON domain-containing protein [Bryobacteraceae bacterium]|jgi:hyperosmotically inducible protein|nr:BON domain-containing protein [Bryobacteraceae bacterium]